ncbi:hypothetical protein J4G07_07675 [Candidatus Poribacteria bacterium]|nr:hypothetical protein [Candidatus Poribacteria bacterium]
MNDTYQVNQHWEKLESRILKPQQVVLVIGATDVGKSTFCRFLVDSAIDRGLKTAFVDTDVGQSQIGPPTTIGMKSFDPESSPVQFDGVADQLYFVGDLSPRGHYLEVLTGARLMVDRARETHADFIVVDTSGYLHDAPAVTLKQRKIELIRPNHVVCLGRSSELKQITAYYSQQDWLNIHYLLPHRNARSKSSKARSRYRKAQFEAYFGDACEPKLAVRSGDACEPKLAVRSGDAMLASQNLLSKVVRLASLQNLFYKRPKIASNTYRLNRFVVSAPFSLPDASQMRRNWKSSLDSPRRKFTTPNGGIVPCASFRQIRFPKQLLPTSKTT